MVKSKNEKLNNFLKLLVCFDFFGEKVKYTYKGLSSAKNPFGNLVLKVCDYVRILISMRMTFLVWKRGHRSSSARMIFSSSLVSENSYGVF